jgi:N-acetylmuramoyl-L-alanine amidase
MSHGSPRSWEGKMPRGIALICLSVCILAGHSHAAQWDREEAENALTRAREIRTQLADANSLDRSEYLRCIKLYKRVWLSDPHFSGCDDAIYEAALLYQEMGGKFKAPEYTQESVDLLRFLVKDYSVSPFRRDARARLAALDGQPNEPAKPGPDSDAMSRPAPQAVAPRTAPPPAGAAEAATRPLSDPAAASSAQINRRAVVHSIRHWTTGDRTRVMIDLDGPVQFQSGRVPNPDRLFFDLSNAELSRDLSGKTIAVGDTVLKQIRTGRNKPGVARVVLDLGRASDVSVSELTNPFRIVIDIRTSGAPESATLSAPAAQTTASPQVPRNNGRENASSRPDSAAAEKSQPQVASGPKPGDKAYIDAMPVLPAAADPPDPGALQKTQPLMPAQIPAQPPRTNGKQAALAQPEPVVAEKTQPPTVVLKPVESAAVPRPTAAAGSAQAGTSNPANGSIPETRESASRSKPSAPSVIYLPAPCVNTPAPADPGTRSAQTAELLPVLPRPAAEPPLKKSTTDRVASGEPATATTRNRDTSPPAKSAVPTSKGDMTMTRVLGLKVGRIVIDPGHGGHDTGTVGRNGLMEKDLVLDVALSLKKSLEERLGAEVLMTRSEDRFISLEERTAIANRRKADLFISIHANASTSRSTSGVETYYLNFAKNAADRQIAARENATTLMSIGELQDLVRKIAMADKSTESRELAGLMQRSLFTGSRGIFPKSRNRGVRSAPFIVLIGAEMPAVLVEVAFISNPRDEKLLRKENSQQVLARALLTGIEGYLKSLASYMADNHPGSN